MAHPNPMLRKHKLGYPASALVVITPDTFIVGGGGGKSKTGIHNRVSMVAFKDDELKELSHVDFGEDRVVGLCDVPAHKVVFCTTAQGKTHEVTYENNKLLRKSTTATAEVPNGEDNSPSQRAIAANKAGDRLLISQGSTINVWRYAKGDNKPLSKDRAIDTLEVHSDDIRDVEISPKGDLFLTIDDGALALWDFEKGTLVTKARPADSGKAAKSPVKLKFRGATFSKDGTKIYTAASGPKGGFIAARSIGGGDKGWAGSTVKDKFVTSDPITSISSREGDNFALGTADGEVALVGGKSLSISVMLEAHGMPVTKVALLPSGNAFSVAFDNTCALSLLKNQGAKMRRDGIVIMIYIFLFLLTMFYFAFGRQLGIHDALASFTT